MSDVGVQIRKLASWIFEVNDEIGSKKEVYGTVSFKLVVNADTAFVLKLYALSWAQQILWVVSVINVDGHGIFSDLGIVETVAEADIQSRVGEDNWQRVVQSLWSLRIVAIKIE